jgi:hypothetical protein
MPESNPRLSEIVRRHLDIHLVTNTDANEVFAHLAGNMGKDLVAVGKGHTKHRARQDLRYRAGQLNWFFFSHANQF